MERSEGKRPPLIEGVEMVQTGVAHLLQRSEEGWTLVRPSARGILPVWEVPACPQEAPMRIRSEPGGAAGAERNAEKKLSVVVLLSRRPGCGGGRRGGSARRAKCERAGS